MNFDFLKLAQIFNPAAMQQSPMIPIGGLGQPPVTMDDPSRGGITGRLPSDISQQTPDLMTMIQGMLSPKDEQFGRYEDVISHMPKREDYAPSKTRKILAAIAGLGTGGPVGISGGQPIGFKADVGRSLDIQNEMLDSPYKKALIDWANTADAQGKIAQMESTRNVNNRATALGTLQRKQAEEKLDETERRNLELERQGRDKLEIQRQRAEAYVKAKQFAQDHPNYKTVTDEKGEVVFWNPQDPTDIIRSGINSGDLGDLEKADLKLKGSLAEINARSKAASVLENQRESNRETLENKKYPNGRPASGKAGSSTPTQDRVKFGNDAAKAAIQHPEWSKWIKIDKGIVTVTPPAKKGIFGISGSGPDQETYNQIASALGLSDQAKSEQSQQKLTPQAPRELVRPEDQRIKDAKSKVEPGYILITDGKSFGQVKPSDISKLPTGWAVVK